MRSVFPPRSYNMYLLLTTPVALFLLIYGIYKWLKRQSEREKEFWNEQKIYGHPVSLKIYGWLKAVLVLIILGGIMLILVSLAYGQVPTLRDFSNPKFRWAACGAAFFILIQCASLGLIRLIRHIGTFNTGKVVLFCSFCSSEQSPPYCLPESVSRRFDGKRIDFIFKRS